MNAADPNVAKVGEIEQMDSGLRQYLASRWHRFSRSRISTMSCPECFCRANPRPTVQPWWPRGSRKLRGRADETC